ncbi:hypothetical protein SEA_ARCHIE_60 [Mycobacterium phage Archie]|uniref:Uncharacterized protein n=1 Tax=Mycobacterium phage Archie TaxID=1718599 RepID=A0A0M4RBL5_9CAUD|nr:hypothetical protein AVU85_gp060 [Mycobacterium phage Archie]ALF00366.1 hypothetical protein SEA_ARCHIE_60 [Mycobacterium phage Archie]
MENPEIGTVLRKDFAEELGPGTFDLYVFTLRGWVFVDQYGLPQVNVVAPRDSDTRLVQLHPKVSED